MPRPDVTAPGLKWRARAGGADAAYWVAPEQAVKAGYQPATQRIGYDIADPNAAKLIRERCYIYQAQVIAWTERQPTGGYDGRLRSLMRLYETDPKSPFHDLKQNTQTTYLDHIRRLAPRYGDAVVEETTGADVSGWYKELAATSGEDEDGKPRLSYAYLSISILKSIISYGASIRAPGCLVLRQEMSVIRFKNGTPRKIRITYGQVKAFRDAAIKAGRPSMALALTLQYEFALRQKDVIGERLRDNDAKAGIRIGQKVWQNGLTWAHFENDGVTRKQTTKTGAQATHRVADYPDLAALLDPVPADRRVGPLVISEQTGLPYTAKVFQRLFRKIATSAGIPDDVWNMDARAGAVTESYEAGATTEGAMALATHTRAETSRRYMRETGEQSSTVAKLRVKSRKKTP